MTTLAASAPVEQTWLQTFSPVQLHGVLMIIGWGFFLNVGTLGARYLRKRPYWFKLHAAFQFIGTLFVLAGFILIVAMVCAQNGTHLHGVHQVAGLASSIVMVLQCVSGLAYRCTWFPGKRPGPLAKWHWMFGKFALAIAIANIGTGMMQMVKEGYKPGYFLYSFLGAFYLIIVLGISVIEIYFVSDEERWTPGGAAGIQSENQPLLGVAQTRKRPRYLMAYAALVAASIVGLVASMYKDLWKK